jgi:protein SCO1/2
MNKRTALRVLGLTAVAWGALALGGCSREAKTSFQGVDVTGAEYAKDIPLRDVDGKQRSLKDFAGKVVVVFFGYTQCPDVCPTTMQELVEVKQQLGADGDRLQGIFVTLCLRHGRPPARVRALRRRPAGAGRRRQGPAAGKALLTLRAPQPM